MTNSENELTLPNLIFLEEFSGDVSAYLSHLYSLFETDFLKNDFFIDGKLVKVRHHPKHDNKVECFWHITSEDDGSDRTPNFRRCEKICWIKAIILQKNSTHVCTWEEKRTTGRGSEIRTHIALADFSYLVVLEERENYWLFITAYPVERDHQRNKLRKRYEDNKP